MIKTIQDVDALIRAKLNADEDRAIHNNINYDNNYYNDLTTNNDCTNTSGKHNIDCSAKPLAESPAVSRETTFSGQADLSVVLHPDWKYLKIDLANNASMEELARDKNRYKLSFSVLSHRSGSYQYFKALMNSEFRMLKRGLTADEYNTEHYQIIEELYRHRLSTSDFTRASKCYMKGQRYKGQSIQQLSTVLSRVGDDWTVDLVIGTHWMPFNLHKQLSDAQRRGNFVATFSQGTERTPKLTASDLFGVVK